MIESFLSWWVARLAELLPRQWRADPNSLPDAILLRVTEAGHIARARRERGRVTALAVHVPPPAGLPLYLALPEGVMLERRIELPLAVASSAAEVVALDFDRLTPFSADAVFWDVAKLGEDKLRGTAQFSLALVPKSQLEPWLAALEREGLHPNRMECERTGAPPRWLAIGGKTRPGFVRISVCGGLALLAAAAVAVPFIRQQIALGRVEARISAATDQAEIAGRLLRRLSPDVSGADRLALAQAQAPRALQTLAAVTAALPADTNLVTLSLQDDHLSMEGTSAAAARLIGLLSAQSMIGDPSFSSPVTRTADGKDAFTLTATVPERAP
jgi:general secretion pathway protein L